MLRRLHAHMQQHNVDFTGGDFHMSAFSTCDVFADPEFSTPGNSFLWGLGALEDSDRECAGFLIMPKRPHEWRVDSHGCFKFNNADLALGARDTTAHLPVLLHLRTAIFPGPDSITRSEQAQQRRLERKATKYERRQRRRKLAQPSASQRASTAFAGKHSVCCLLVVPAASEDLHWCSTRASLTYAVARTRSRYGDDEAGEGAAARQDHMSAHDLTRSAGASEF